ncbi:MAG: hypothetical protein GY941_26940 [Planctomycetes bacterium]|nr:hypothetical protein [Planctomycetota bacterium]
MYTETFSNTQESVSESESEQETKNESSDECDPKRVTFETEPSHRFVFVNLQKVQQIFCVVITDPRAKTKDQFQIKNATRLTTKKGAKNYKKLQSMASINKDVVNKVMREICGIKC